MKRLCVLLLLVACNRERDITVGSDKETSGNYWGRGVSKQFEEPQLHSLYAVMNSPATDAEITALHCGKAIPQHEYSVTLWTEGEYRERIVRLQMTPRLYKDDDCLQEAVNYVFNVKVKEIDTGPPIDYGYKNPRTGEHLDTSKIERELPEKPECRCSP